MRFLAAVWVAVAHFRYSEVITGTFLDYMPVSGRDAVVIFFVLSGYVVLFSAQTRNHSLRSYTVSRAARIYSVALPLLLGTAAIDLIGIAQNPDLYEHLYQYEKLEIYIPFHLLFLGELWFFNERPFTNTAYWSLGYEVWYYIFFAALFYLRGWKRLITAGVLFLIMGFKLWLLLPVWFAGVALYHFRDKWRLSKLPARILFFGTIGFYLWLEHIGLDAMLWNLTDQILDGNRITLLRSASKFASDYVVAILVVINIHVFQHCEFGFGNLSTKVIRKLARYTFTLYLLHYPVYVFIARNFDYDKEGALGISMVILVTAVATYLVGLITEDKKHVFAAVISRLLDCGDWVWKKMPLVQRRA